ncbi:hypothetical protein RvY_00196 [Ramazzottius varieornatus]|uniref:Angiotensin-converting enzyme n=1 Tax=Ramazzottius varieornatus TaxID=947166 RepID=A0A1D1UI84_RAMVA|nr:hypothetical protein RvY_00196 [Ramazzottius varieornatus]
MYSTALKKIAFLPFGLVMDMYRYDVFNGKISMQELNRKWWEYVVKYQGICHAVPRDESDFDPGAKFHTAADVPYMRYFVSFVIQFQFHEALCGVANHSGPLHTCDIDGSKEAGAILGQALSLGSSKPWQEAMRIITGQDQMDAQPLLSYFKPLQDWLQAENRRLKQTVGWVEDASCIEDVTTMPTIPTVSTLSTVPSVSSSQTMFVSPITEPDAGGSTSTDSSASRTTTPPPAATSPSAEVASTSTTNEPVESTTASAGSLSLPLLLHALALYALLFCVRF